MRRRLKNYCWLLCCILLFFRGDGNPRIFFFPMHSRFRRCGIFPLIFWDRCVIFPVQKFPCAENSPYRILLPPAHTVLCGVIWAQRCHRLSPLSFWGMPPIATAVVFFWGGGGHAGAPNRVDHERVCSIQVGLTL